VRGGGLDENPFKTYFRECCASDARLAPPFEERRGVRGGHLSPVFASLLSATAGGKNPSVYSDAGAESGEKSLLGSYLVEPHPQFLYSSRTREIRKAPFRTLTSGMTGHAEAGRG